MTGQRTRRLPAIGAVAGGLLGICRASMRTRFGWIPAPAAVAGRGRRRSRGNAEESLAAVIVERFTVVLSLCRRWLVG